MRLAMFLRPNHPHNRRCTALLLWFNGCPPISFYILLLGCKSECRYWTSGASAPGADDCIPTVSTQDERPQRTHGLRTRH